jgi:DNA primase
MSGPNNVGGPCPFHKHGEEKKPSFYINLLSGVFYCHACGAKGTFVQFLRRMGAPCDLIDLTLEEVEKQPKRPRRDTTANAGKGEHFLNEAILGIFQYLPTDLVKAGFDPKLLQRLEIGFDRHQMRIIFPIRDLEGRLVGLAGRTVLGDGEKYRVYKAPDILPYAPDDPLIQARYEHYDIKSHNFLWNGHNVYPLAFFDKLDTVVVVEGYKACIWLIQHDIDNVVALQGSRMSGAQERIFSRLNCTIILFLDNNKAGKEGMLDAGRRLRRRGLSVLCVTYPDWADDHTQPDNLDQASLLGVLDAATDWHFWRSR